MHIVGPLLHGGQSFFWSPQPPEEFSSLWLGPCLFATIICFNRVSQIAPVTSQFETELTGGEGVEVAAGGRKKE